MQSKALIQTVRDASRDSASRYRAAHTLYETRPLPEEALSVFTELLQEKDEKLRLLAITVLKDFKFRAADAVPTLVKLYSKETSQGRLQIIYCLGYIGSQAKPAVPLLNKALIEPDKTAAAIWALSEIGPEAEEVVPTLAEIIQNPKNPPKTRFSAAVALNVICQEAKHTLPVWIRLLKDNDPELSVFGLEVLKNFGQKAQAAVPVLMEMFKTERGSFRREIADCLRVIQFGK